MIKIIIALLIFLIGCSTDSVPEDPEPDEGKGAITEIKGYFHVKAQYDI